MKTSTFKTLLVALSSILFVQLSYADAGIYITAKGTQSFDQMWIFSNANCTRGFDNGWDGYKMIASSASVQLYAAEASGNFQVDAVPDFNNTYLAFKAGADTEYTLTFTYQELELYYQQLYLIDSVANKIVNIYTAGTQYVFTAGPTDVAVKRFKIVTYNPTPVVVVPPVVIVPPIVVVPPVVVEPPVVVPPVAPVEMIKIYTNKKIIVIDNATKQKGSLTVCDARTGKTVKTATFNAIGITNISTTLKAGTYVAKATTASYKVTKTIIIQ